MLFMGQICSDFGNWLYFTALSVIVVYEWHMGPTALAMLAIALGAPWVLVGPFINVWTEQLPKRALMIICDIVRVLIVTVLIWAPNLYVLLVLVFLKESLSAIFDPTRQATIRMIVPEETLPQANALSQLSVNTSKILAPALGGFLLVFWPPQASFAIEAILFVISAFFISRLPSLRPDEHNKSEGKIGFKQDFKQGFGHIQANKTLAISISLISAGLFIIFLYDKLLVLWTNLVGLDQSAFGYLMSAVGLGSVVGALIAGQWTGWKNQPLMIMALSKIISGLFIILLGFGALGYMGGNLYTWFALFFIMGLVGAASIVPFGFILQSETPPQLMGRVASTANAVQNFSMLIAPAIGALIAEYVGLGVVFTGAGLGMSLLGMIVWGYLKRSKSSSVSVVNEIKGDHI
jgi:predicted MFS family arabinose efflux permease